MTKISDLEEVEGELDKAKHDLNEIKQSVLRQLAYISLLETHRRNLIGDLDEVDTPSYHFARENKHYDKPSNWKVSVIDKEAAIKELSDFDSSFVKHEWIERDVVDSKAIKRSIANGVVDGKQFKSIVISKIKPKISVKAKVD